MDRIDKFLSARPSKKKRHVKVGNKEVEITKEDMLKVRRYRNRECLDAIDLCGPLNTKYSRVPGVPVQKPSKKDASLAHQKRAIEKLQREQCIAASRPKKTESDAWTSFDCVGGAELVNVDAYDQEKYVGDYVFSAQDLAKYLRDIDDALLRPAEKAKNVAVDDFVPTTKFPTREAKTLCVGDIDAVHKSVCFVRNGDGYAVVDLKTGIAVRQIRGERISVRGNNIFVLRGDEVVATDFFGNTKCAFRAGTAKPESAITEFAVGDDCVVFCAKDGVAVVAKADGKAERRRIRGVSKVAVGAKMFFLSRSTLWSVGFSGNVLRCSAQDFSVGDATVVASGNDVVVDGRRMHQRGHVRFVCAHAHRALFCAGMENELRVFCYEKGAAIKVKLCARIPGRFSNAVFDAAHARLFATRDGQLRLIV